MKGLVILDGQPRNKPGFFGKRRLRKSVQLFEQVIQLNPKNWQSMFFIGKNFQSLGEFQQALDWFMRAHNIVPENPSVAKEIGLVAAQIGRHDIAIPVMESVAQLNPKDAALHFNLGLSCLMSKRLELAHRAFAQAVELEPQQILNRKLLNLTIDVETGKRPCPKSEPEIFKAIGN